mgnify:FL=1
MFRRELSISIYVELHAEFRPRPVFAPRSVPGHVSAGTGSDRVVGAAVGVCIRRWIATVFASRWRLLADARAEVAVARAVVLVPALVGRVLAVEVLRLVSAEEIVAARLARDAVLNDARLGEVGVVDRLLLVPRTAAGAQAPPLCARFSVSIRWCVVTVVPLAIEASRALSESERIDGGRSEKK